MKYRIETWSLWDLVTKYKASQLDLNPPYQRQFIWSKKDQQILLRSVLNGIAIPNIFVQEARANNYFMVDGQQRTRTILAFVNHALETFEGIKYNPKTHDPILKSYKIPVTIITKLDHDETIEAFYALVNKAGIHLNRPELKTAEYFDTRFMKLIKELADLDDFVKLGLFSDATTKRMTDEDFTSELLSLLKDGVSDKKISVDRLYEKDITSKEAADLKKEFKRVVKVFKQLNESVQALRKTRYKQRNDFYTLFGFVHGLKKMPLAFTKHVYKLLVLFDQHIVPSNDECEPFQQYAFHCVSQSNSKSAREERAKILAELFLNEGTQANVIQRQVLKFYGLDGASMVSKNGYLTFSEASVKKSNRYATN